MEHYLQAIIALLAVANPVGAIPIFHEIVGDAAESQRRTAALQVSVAVFVILAVAAFAGSWILGVFGVSVPAFRCGGGFVILIMGLEMLSGKTSRVHHDQNEFEEDLEDKLMVPLAMPLIAGPGAITTVMTMSLGDHHWQKLPVAMTAVFVLVTLLFLVLSFSIRINDAISPRTHRIFIRFLGLILVAIGVQFVLAGAYDFISTYSIPTTNVT